MVYATATTADAYRIHYQTQSVKQDYGPNISFVQKRRRTSESREFHIDNRNSYVCPPLVCEPLQSSE